MLRLCIEGAELEDFVSEVQTLRQYYQTLYERHTELKYFVWEV